MQSGTVNKVKLPDGSVHNLPGNRVALVYEEDDESVYWTINNLTGTVEAISGMTDYYQLNVNSSAITPTT